MAKSIHSLHTTTAIELTLDEVKPFAISLPDAKRNPSTNDFCCLPQNLLTFAPQRLGIRRTLSDSILHTAVTSDGHLRSTFDRRFALGLSSSEISSKNSSTSSTFCSFSGSTTESSDSSYVLPISASQLSLPEPPDGGWGWVVVFAAFMVHMITDGIIVSFGVLIEDLLNEFQQSISATSWIGSFSYGVPALVTPIASLCVDRFGCRTTCMLGGVISAVGCMSGAFTNSVLHLVFTFGILSGIGASFSITSALVIVSMYFDDRRATATGLSIAGTGVGALVFAPLVEILLKVYTWRGTFLLMAGIFLNLTVFGALMRPVETRLERRHRQRLAWLEHMAKTSGILSVTNTNSYINLDVLGRIKLLRDELLSPRCTRSSNSDPFSRNSDVSYIQSAKQNESEELTLVGRMTNKTNTILNAGRLNNQNRNGLLKIQKPTELSAIPESCRESKSVKDTTAKCLVEYHPCSLSAECSHVSSAIQTELSSSLGALVNFNSVDNYINQTSNIPRPLARTRSLPVAESLRRSRKIHLCDKPVFKSEKRQMDTNCVTSDIDFIQKSCQATRESSIFRTAKSATQDAITVGHNKLHSKVVISNAVNFNRPCDRVDIFYRYSVNQALHHTRSIGLSLPDLHKTHRNMWSSRSSESDSSSDSDFGVCCYCPVPKIGDASVNGTYSHRSILTKFQNFICCDNLSSENAGRRLFRRMCDLRLFAEPKFAFFVLSNVLLYFWYNVTYFFLIVHASALGVPETTSALLFSVLGGANMIGEVVVGFLADREWVDALTLYLIMLLACGVSTSSVPFLTTFVLLSLYAGVFGFALAANDALCTILIVEFVGLERLTNGLGVCFFCQGVANIFGPPFIGYIIDSTSSVNSAFIISGIGLTFAGLSVVPVIIQRFRRHRARLRRRKLLAERQKAPQNSGAQKLNKT